MKTNFRKFFSVLAVAAMVSAVALTGCKSDDDEVTPVPDEVGSTIESAYYITGIVTSGGNALSGATVTSGSVSETTGSDGVYTLKMSSTATATVSFSKDGYVSINATAVFASGATAGDAVTLSQELTATVEPQTATAGSETQLTFEYTESTEDIVVTVPATALTEDVDISATYYIPTATPEAAESIATIIEDSSSTTVVSSLSAVNLEPSGTTFDTPVTISIPSDYVEGAYHAKLVDGEWEYQGDATYNTETNSYEIEVSGFSQHSIAVESIVSVSSSSSSTVTLTTKEIDNIGKTSAISQSVSYTQNAGWSLAVGSSTTLSTYVASLMGSVSGTSTISNSIDVSVAGDEKVTVTVTQQVITTEFKVGLLSATVTSYGDVSVSTVTEQGDLRPDHN